MMVMTDEDNAGDDDVDDDHGCGDIDESFSERVKNNHVEGVVYLIRSGV